MRRGLSLCMLLLSALLFAGAVPPMLDSTYAPLQDREMIGAVAQAGVWTGTIEIIKDDVTNGGTDFDFTASGGTINPTGFILDDDGTSNKREFPGLLEGVSYTITEQPETGYTVTNITCATTGGTDSAFTINGAANDGDFDTGDNSVSIILAAGETVTCTFENTPQGGSITIIKDSIAADGSDIHAQDFDFLASGTGIADFTLDDDGNNSTASGGLSNTKTFTGLVAGGTRTVTEDTINTFSVSNISCTGSAVQIGGQANGFDNDFDPGDDAVSIVLAINAVVTCVFENTETPPECGSFQQPNPVRILVPPGGGTFDSGNQDQILVGSSSADHIVGGNSKDCIIGNGGNDVLEGENGPDALLGGDGDDLLLGGEGPDIVNGGPGTDDVCEDFGPGGDTDSNCESDPADLEVEQSDESPAAQDLDGPNFTAAVEYTLSNTNGGGGMDLAPADVTFSGSISGATGGASSIADDNADWSCTASLTSWSCSGDLDDDESVEITITITGLTASHNVTFTPAAPVCTAPLTCTDGSVSAGNVDGGDLTPAPDVDDMQ